MLHQALFGTFSLVVSLVAGASQLPPFHPPVAGDVRSPCPVVNALANHGLISHDGVGITKETLSSALAAIGISSAVAAPLVSGGMGLGTTGSDGVQRLNLDQLDKHNAIEHDASLSRGDIFFGDNHSFNQTIFDRVEKFLTTGSTSSSCLGRRPSGSCEPQLTFQGLARWRSAVERNCQTSNPQCDLSLKAKTIGTGEAALLHLFLKQDDSIPYSSLKTLFVEGRIPDERNDVGIASLLSTLVALRTRITFVRRRALESNEFPNSFTEEDWIKLFQ